MIEILCTHQPIARKEHHCDYCDGIIHKGEKYERSAVKFDGEVYTWKSHLYCSSLARKIEPIDEGVGEEDFEIWIDEYVHENHCDDKLDDIALEWKNKSYQELAKMIYNELKGIKL